MVVLKIHAFHRGFQKNSDLGSPSALISIRLFRIAYFETCACQDIPCYVFRSKSGTGYHAYIFFDIPISAWKARAVANALLEETQVVGDGIAKSSFDKLFPAQESFSGKGFGNLIALPFQGKASKAGHTLILDPDTGFQDPFSDQCATLVQVEKADESKVEEVGATLVEGWNPVDRCV